MIILMKKKYDISCNNDTSYEGTFWCAAAARPSSTRQVLHKQERTKVQGKGAPNIETRGNRGQLSIAQLAGSPCIGGCISEVVHSRLSINHVEFCSAGRLASRPPIPCGSKGSQCGIGYPLCSPQHGKVTALLTACSTWDLAPKLRRSVVSDSRL